MRDENEDLAFVVACLAVRSLRLTDQMSTTPIIEKCRVPDCPVCKIKRRVRGETGKAAPRFVRVRVLPGQMRLGDKPARLG
jgi:hypothetical protein